MTCGFTSFQNVYVGGARRREEADSFIGAARARYGCRSYFRYGGAAEGAERGTAGDRTNPKRRSERGEDWGPDDLEPPRVQLRLRLLKAARSWQPFHGMESKIEIVGDPATRLRLHGRRFCSVETRLDR